MNIRPFYSLLPIAIGLALTTSKAQANFPDIKTLAPVACQKDTAFEPWLGGVFKEASKLGISSETLEAARFEMTYDANVIRLDHSQGVFQKSFLDFASTRDTQGVIQHSQSLIKKYKDLFSRIERDYGIPPQVLVTFWGLETSFGSDLGKSRVLTAVTTLAYDCRRAPIFRRELFSLLKVIDRGDQQPGQMFGDWAGELGGMQITPTDYFDYAVDYDGDGRRDLVNSIPDTMASAANFLAHLGWKRGQPWLQEVRVPDDLPWQEADLAISHSRAQWAKWGVTGTSGELTNDNMPASLLLPMGRFGPAFLAYDNFKNAYLGWNSALVYSTTAAYVATRITGAPKVSPGTGVVNVLKPAQILELQRLLTKQGYDVGVPDGKLGTGTRAAIKQAQIKAGLPADSYPSVELIEALQ
jgi:lytic murein transglycosylase